VSIVFSLGCSLRTSLASAQASLVFAIFVTIATNRTLRRLVDKNVGNEPGGVIHLTRTVRFPRYAPLLQRHAKTAPPPKLPLAHLPSIRTRLPPRCPLRSSKAEKSIFPHRVSASCSISVRPRKSILHQADVESCPQGVVGSDRLVQSASRSPECLVVRSMGLPC